MDIQAATQQTKMLSQMFKAVVDLGTFLEKQGSLENYAKELQAKIESLKIDIEKEEKSLSSLVSDREAFLRSAEKVINEAKIQEGVIISNAKNEAVKIREEATQIVADAQAKANEILSFVNSKNDELMELHRSVEDKQKEHVMIEDMIKEAKSKIGAL